jgi:hypothetical protein
MAAGVMPSTPARFTIATHTSAGITGDLRQPTVVTAASAATVTRGAPELAPGHWAGMVVAATHVVNRHADAPVWAPEDPTAGVGVAGVGATNRPDRMHGGSSQNKSVQLWRR